MVPPHTSRMAAVRRQARPSSDKEVGKFQLPRAASLKPSLAVLQNVQQLPWGPPRRDENIADTRMSKQHQPQLPTQRRNNCPDVVRLLSRCTARATVNIMEYQLAVRRTGVLPGATVRLNLENNKLSERTVRKKHALCNPTHMGCPEDMFTEPSGR